MLSLASRPEKQSEVRDPASQRKNAVPRAFPEHSASADERSPQSSSAEKLVIGPTLGLVSVFSQIAHVSKERR